MDRPISTRTHGMIDYAFAAALIGLPFALGWGGRAKALSVGSGLTTLGLSMMTRYEFGLLPLVSMKAHLGVDAAESSMLLGAPRMLRGSDASAGRVLAALGLVGGVVGSLTQLQPRRLPGWR